MESDNMEGDNYTLGVDVGGIKPTVLLVRTGRKKTDGIEFLERCTIPTKGSWQEVLGTLALCKREVVRRHSILPDDCVIDISCGGSLDSGSGVTLSPPNLPGWDEVPTMECMEQRLGTPARLKNDADACALAEWRYGAGQGYRHMVSLAFETGLGTELILNGGLYQGACDMAGETGHIWLSQDGPVGYGKVGSFEGLCSGGGIAQLARRTAAEALKKGKNVSYSGKKRLDFITTKDVAETTECDVEDTLQVYGCSGRCFGRGPAVLIDILNLERIAVRSVFTRSGKLIREEMGKEPRKEVLPESLVAYIIMSIALEDRVEDYGAVVAALE